MLKIKSAKEQKPTGLFSMDDMNYNRANPEVRSTAWAEDDKSRNDFTK